MSEPRRLLEDAGDCDLTRAMLRSARDDAPSPEARRKTLVALGLGGSVIAAGTTASAASAASAVTTGGASATTVVSAGGAALVKWAGIGVLGGLLTLGGVQLAQIHGAASAPAAPVAARVRHGAAVRAISQKVSASTSIEARAGEERALETRGQGAPRDEAAAPPPAPDADAEPAIGDRRAEPAERPAARPRAGAQAAARAEAERASTEGATRTAPSAAPAQQTLADEVAVLDRAREALAAGDPQRAFAALEKHDGQFAGGLLGPEAEVLRVEAAALRGDSVEVQRFANQFFARYPDSPLIGRVRKIVSAVSPASRGVEAPAPPGGRP